MRKLVKSKLLYVICCGIFLIAASVISGKAKTEYVPEPVSIERSTEDQVTFLSDIPYSSAQVGYGTINLDKTSSNTALTLVVNGSSTAFKKGIWAHATSTVEYDISKYKDFAYFITYYGVNTTSQNKGNGVKFYIYTSKDGKEWDLRTEEEPAAKMSSQNAGYVKIDIKNANYIRLYAHDNGANGFDHAIWADTKLVKEGYNDNVLKTVEEFDEIIKSQYTSGRVNDNLKLTLLQRDLVNRMGQYQLRCFLEADPKNEAFLEWFLNNEEALRLWTVGGLPNGTYQRALQVLSNLYHAHKADLENENVTANGTKYKDLYLKMMLSLSLSHSTNIGLWIGGNQLSDALTRYEIYKEMHLNNKLGSNRMFESYTIEEMRRVMSVNIDDEEIKWLNDYSRRYSATAGRFNPYKYITYTKNYGYYRPKYYAPENYAIWDQKYNLSKYNITYQAGKPKLWIVFEEGAVCGGLSKTAANLYGSWGYPAHVVGQPAHAAYIYMYDAGGGNYAWQLANNVVSTGWANTQGFSRMPNGWGNTGIETNSGGITSASYVLLAQTAQNEYDKYEQAELIMLLQSVYKDDRAKLERIYRDALDEEIINLDAWIGLVNLYITDSSKSEADLIELAEEIRGVMTYHPLPMYDLTRRLGTKIKSPEYRGKLMMLQDATLRTAAKATSANTIYHKEVPIIANAILGVVDSKIASFSFDGANAGKIILSKQLQSTQVTWSYSLDGGGNGSKWVDCYEPSVQLTDSEIASINDVNDIKIHITGLPLTEANIYTIDITKGIFPSGTVTINDYEDRMYGMTNKMEWTMNLNEGWNSFANTNPMFDGDKKVYVRLGATGTCLASNPVTFTFTNNSSEETKKYISISELKVKEVSGTKSGNKDSIIDGNINTAWRSYHGNLNTAYVPAYATIELQEPRYISALDYVPDKNAQKFNAPIGRAKDVEIYVSMDGTTWELAASPKNLANNANLKQIVFPEAKKAKYVKFSCTAVYTGPYNTLTIALINLYENTAVDETPRAVVNYNITKPTNQDVTVDLIKPTRHITVTNNGGKTSYTFKKNGEFTFEFVDDYGHTGSASAKVDWIDKVAPQANVTFNNTEPTNDEVVATLSFTKPVTILSKDVQVAENKEDKSQTITFDENATYVLEFVDSLGNIGSKTIAVDWIDTEAPHADFTFNTTDLTDKPVIAKLNPSEEVKITNNDGSDTYTFNENGEFTFEFEDMVGNKGTATVSVYWISKVPGAKLTYSNKKPTNKDVVVTLDIEEGYRLMNNGGSNIYTFKDSGEFAFEYVDSNGVMGRIPVVVDWIDKIDPTAEFKFSTKKATNKTVVATLKPSEDVKILNNSGKDTYAFKNNGEFTFEMEDKAGNKGNATAKVNWIDRVVPTATLAYDIKNVTNKSVSATLKPSEEVTILNNGGKDKYIFDKNGEFTFQFMDLAGNKNKAVAKVKWIDKIAPTATIEYSTREQTNGTVLATLRPKENVKVLNNEGNNTYTFKENGTFTFEFSDAAGNKATATAKVDWIKKKQGNTADSNSGSSAGTNSDSSAGTNSGSSAASNSGSSEGSNNGSSAATNIVLNTGANKTPSVRPSKNQNYAANAVRPSYKSSNTKTAKDNKTYQKVTSSNNSFSVKLPKAVLSQYKDATLTYQSLSLSDAQKERYGKTSEMFELYFETKDGIAFNVKKESIEKTVRLNPNKQFVAIYGVNEDGSIVKLDYDINANNELVFKSAGLGKYIISYKSDVSEAEEKANPAKNSDTSKSSLQEEEEAFFPDKFIEFLPYIAIALVLLAGVFFLVARRGHGKEQ